MDICIMEKPADANEHVLTAAALCFPANWHLSEKINRPMTAIHEPVEDYDALVAKRVQRIFDAMRPERPVWRMNYLHYRDAELFQPYRLRPVKAKDGKYVRCERQTLIKLPDTDAIIFGTDPQPITPAAFYHGAPFTKW